MGKTFCFMESIAILSRGPGYNHIHPGYNYIPTYPYSYIHITISMDLSTATKELWIQRQWRIYWTSSHLISAKDQEKVVKTTCGHLCVLYYSGSQWVKLMWSSGFIGEIGGSLFYNSWLLTTVKSTITLFSFICGIGQHVWNATKVKENKWPQLWRTCQNNISL